MGRYKFEEENCRSFIDINHLQTLRTSKLQFILLDFMVCFPINVTSNIVACRREKKMHLLKIAKAMRTLYVKY